MLVPRGVTGQALVSIMGVIGREAMESHPSLKHLFILLCLAVAWRAPWELRAAHRNHEIPHIVWEAPFRSEFGCGKGGESHDADCCISSTKLSARRRKDKC